MTSISKNVYIDKLDNIVNKYNNTYHNTIEMKNVDVKSNTYIDSSKEVNDKNQRFKIGDNARIWLCSKFKLDLFSYATKADLKNAAEIDTSPFTKKVDLTSLKSNVDKSDIDKLKHVQTNLSNFRSKVDKLGVDKLIPVPELFLKK